VGIVAAGGSWVVELAAFARGRPNDRSRLQIDQRHLNAGYGPAAQGHGSLDGPQRGRGANLDGRRSQQKYQQSSGGFAHGKPREIQ
jgi:hypothetical protein